MAHFARIENEIVREITVVNNEILLDENGIEQEMLGIDFLKTLFGSETNWVQTSYNGNFRGHYAVCGMRYKKDQGRFEYISDTQEFSDEPTDSE
jgi:hypothetical protein